MKVRHLLFPIFLLSSCSIIYGKSSFVYKSPSDWRNMTVEEAQTIINNGGNIKSANKQGQTPLSMVCQYNTHLSMIKFLIEKGANPNDCNLSRYVNNAAQQNDFTQTKRNLEHLISLGIKPNSETVDEMLYKFPDKHKEIVKFFAKYKVKASKEFVHHMIQKKPLEYKKILSLYNVQVSNREIALWRVNSIEMQKQRWNNHWYRLVDELKRLNIKSGEIGMSEADYHLTYGIPDKEYKINDSSKIVLYTQEYKKNIPIQARSHFYFITRSNYISIFNSDDTTSYNPNSKIVDDDIHIDEAEIIVYFDKGIVTGSAKRDRAMPNKNLFQTIMDKINN